MKAACLRRVVRHEVVFWFAPPPKCLDAHLNDITKTDPSSSYLTRRVESVGADKPCLPHC